MATPDADARHSLAIAARATATLSAIDERLSTRKLDGRPRRRPWVAAKIQPRLIAPSTIVRQGRLGLVVIQRTGEQ